MIYKIIFKIQNSKLKTAVSWYLVQQILPISHLKKKIPQIHVSFSNKGLGGSPLNTN